MTTKQKDEPQRERENSQQRLSTVIGDQVLHSLGSPGDLQLVQVRRLWDEHYRVNVLVGVDAASARVAHSYFLVVDDGGRIVASTPSIARKY
jgi:hypothetical protein